MRAFTITVNGQEYAVEIEDPNASPATVVVNGEIFSVTLDEQSTAKPAPGTVSDDIEPDVDYVPMVTTTFVESAPEPADEPAATSAAPAAAAGSGQAVTAPMPGKIMDIVAKVGDQIKQGDVLCNLEAMKMKSPIRSTGDGVIAQVLISEGQNVKYGDVLFTLN